MKITIATRRSPLALWQAEHVAELIRGAFDQAEVSLLGVQTQGDRILDQSLAKIGGKGLFIKELEQAMLDGRADIAVHSMKDVPANLPEGFCVGAVLPRHDPRDALLGKNLAELPLGARVGTSSLRRQGQLAHLRPDLKLLPLRGNVQTRIAKLGNGDYEAIVLAVAGLQRLGLEHAIAEMLDPDICLPAIGQGVIGVECLQESQAAQWLKTIEDTESRMVLDTERELNRAIGGSCVSPLAGFAELTDGQLTLQAVVADPDGTDLIKAIATGTDPIEVGNKAAQRLLELGAQSILDRLAS